MNRRSLITIAVGICGIAMIIVGGQKVSLLSLIGTFLFSSAGILIGLDAIKSRKFILTSRYDRRQNETYSGIAAILQGGSLIFMAVSVFGLVSTAYFGFGKELFFYMIQRPGIPLFLFGLFLLPTALSSFLGYEEQNRVLQYYVRLELITSRLLPGIILFVIALLILTLGMIEIISPKYFDSIGGQYLELLFPGAK